MFENHVKRNTELKKKTNKAISGELYYIIILYCFCDESLSVFKWDFFFSMYQTSERKLYYLAY